MKKLNLYLTKIDYSEIMNLNFINESEINLLEEKGIATIIYHTILYYFI